MGYRIQDLTAATVLTPATDLLEFQQLSQSAPTSRKVTLAQLLASTLQPANNLSDIVSATAARANLGLGSAAQQASSVFAQVANNLSDLLNAATARTNLGLGSAATHAATDFDVAGAATGLSEKESQALSAGFNLVAAANANGSGLDVLATAGEMTVARLAPKIYSVTVDASIPAGAGGTGYPKRWRLAIYNTSVPAGFAFGRMMAAFVSSGSYVIPNLAQIGFTTALDQATTFIPAQLTVDTTATKSINGSAVWWIDVNPIATTTAGNWVAAANRFTLSAILVSP
jgi:hypothetical protein